MQFFRYQLHPFNFLAYILLSLAFQHVYAQIYMSTCFFPCLCLNLHVYVLFAMLMLRSTCLCVLYLVYACLCAFCHIYAQIYMSMCFMPCLYVWIYMFICLKLCLDAMPSALYLLLLPCSSVWLLGGVQIQILQSRPTSIHPSFNKGFGLVSL